MMGEAEKVERLKGDKLSLQTVMRVQESRRWPGLVKRERKKFL